MSELTPKTRVVGIDLGIESTTYAVVDIRGNIIARDSFSTTDYPNVDNFVSVLCEKIIQMVEENGGYETIRSVGICAPNSNFMTGCIENAPNMPWKGVIPIAAMMRDRLGLAVALANNSQVIALGEHSFGAAHGLNDFIIITLGHGMGSCIFSNGHMHLGNLGFAGEIGHTCIVPNGRECKCGHHGCLETYTAQRGILLTADEVMKESNQPSLMRNAEKLSPKIITEFCEQGDELSIEVMKRTGYMLGFGLAYYASILNPEAFVLTGGIPKAGKWLLEPMQASFDEHVFGNIRGKTRILVSHLDNQERDVLGASVLAWQVKEYSLFK